MNATGGDWPTLHLRTTRGVLDVKVCPLCAAVYDATGEARHDAEHAAVQRRIDEVADRTIALLDAIAATLGARSP